jgi:hypothetical protein
MRNEYKILMTQFRGPRRIWEINIDMDESEIGWKGADKVELAQDRFP